MHRAEVLVLRTDSNHLVYYLDCIRVFGVQTCDESVGIARLYHHHTKVVALKHLIVSLLESIAVALTLLCQYAGITFAALLLIGMTQVHNLDAIQIQIQFLGHLLDHLVVTQ